MNLIDKLLASDEANTKKRAKKVLKSKRLYMQINGTSGGTEDVTIQQVSPKKANDIQSMLIKANGELNLDKSMEAELHWLVAGVVDPPLNDTQLLEHFNCKTPKDLAAKLFREEISVIAKEIQKLSISDEIEVEKEQGEVVKN